MKVKRLIKSFIYLFPFMFLIVNALSMIIPTVKISSISDISRPTGVDIEDYRQLLQVDRQLDFDSFVYPIINAYGFINSEDTPLYDAYNQLLRNIGLDDSDIGAYLQFTTWILTYETYAIIICAIIDVIFLIPEFYNKLEDKYIRGGKKRE